MSAKSSSSRAWQSNPGFLGERPESNYKIHHYCLLGCCISSKLKSIAGAKHQTRHFHESHRPPTGILITRANAHKRGLALPWELSVQTHASFSDSQSSQEYLKPIHYLMIKTLDLYLTENIPVFLEKNVALSFVPYIFVWAPWEEVLIESLSRIS